jgi:endonuclease III
MNPKVLSDLPKMLSVIRREVKPWKQPIVGDFATGENAVFKVLISTLLSLRTQDKTTEKASQRLFERAETPQQLLKLSEKEIETLIYPVGFYRTKAKTLKNVCRLILEKHGGRVPATLEELLALPGVGRKTANLVMTVGHNRPGICVDTHVHRISNRWGLVKTKTPDETEFRLREILPKRYWIEFNDLLVCYGQNLCQPVSPRCSLCKLRDLCPRVGVKKHR